MLRDNIIYEHVLSQDMGANSSSKRQATSLILDDLPCMDNDKVRRNRCVHTWRM